MPATTTMTVFLAMDRHGHPVISHPFDQQTPAVERQSSITVTHEDLR